MKYGLSLGTRSDYDDIHLLVEMAVMAEEAGWDGYFLWDHFAGTCTDPWISLAAVACNTQTLRFGTMITPLARRRPWKVAREILALDQLSNGRVTLGVGLGDFKGQEFEAFGEVTDNRTRGEMLDEGLEIIDLIQKSETFKHEGKHYRASGRAFQPGPVQTPRIPVWVAGVWPNKPPFRRAARWDGIVPLVKGKNKKQLITPDEVREMVDYIGKFRSVDTPLEVSLGGITPGKSHAQDKAIVEPYEEAGVTWWLEYLYSGRGSIKKVKERIMAGPPR